MKIFLLGVVIYLVICAFMYFRQVKLIFPTQLVPYSKADKFFITKDNKKLETKIFTNNDKNNLKPVVVLFTGNAQNSILTGEIIFNGFKQQVILATINYRGYGNSEGKANERDILNDALYFTQYIKSNYKNNKIYVMGISLGTGVASYVAANLNVDGVILMTPYDSIVNVAKSEYPWLPVGLLLKHRFESKTYISSVKSPVIVIRAEKDSLILSKHTDNLIKSITNLADDVSLENMEHTEVLEPENIKLLQKTLKNTLQKLK